MLKHNVGAQIISSPGNRGRLREQLDWNMHNRILIHPRGSEFVCVHGAKMRDGRGADERSALAPSRRHGRPREHEVWGPNALAQLEYHASYLTLLLHITTTTCPLQVPLYTSCPGKASMREQVKLRMTVYGTPAQLLRSRLPNAGSS